MQTHHKRFVFAVMLWAGFTDGDCSGEKESGHRDEAHISREGGGRGMLRIA